MKDAEKPIAIETLELLNPQQSTGRAATADCADVTEEATP